MNTNAAIDLDFAMHDPQGLFDWEPRVCRLGHDEVRCVVSLEEDRIEVELLDAGPRTDEEARKLIRWAIATAHPLAGCTAAYSRLLQARVDEGFAITWL